MLDSEEKRLLLKDFNHRLNNDLQALLAFIKLQKRFGIDDGEIISFSCVSIASVSAIQNLMYYSESSENLIGAGEFFRDFVKILEDNFSIEFDANTDDFAMNGKLAFHIMLLLNDMVNISQAFSFDGDESNKITFALQNDGDECLLTYSDNGSGIGEILSGSDFRAVLFDQLVKQIEGTLESSDGDSIISVKFPNN